ncbi:MAG: NERD domain-containing protein [Zoogloeaceae bacterium]|nr:NERD domain-containing protein [Zoogloeaceae bacterium]
MIIKSPDDRSKRLRLLEELRKSDRLDNRQKDWLRSEYQRFSPGLAGELDAVHYIDSEYRDGQNHAVLHDLRLEVDGHVAQIDHLVVNRFLMFFLLETKTYNGSLEINEYGEFSVEYAGERRYGIESPLEQSRRHEPILRKVLAQLGITGRAGTEPTFVHVVMVHPKAIIKRPPADKFDTSMVIKADQFRTWHVNYVDAMSTGTFLAKTINFSGRDTVREWGEKLKSAHCRTDPLALPSFMKPRAVTATHCATPPTDDARPVAVPANQVTEPPRPSTQKPICATCGKPLTVKVAKFCQDKAAWFGGQLYCYDHQAAAKRA